QALAQSLLELERLAEVEAGLEEEDRDVGADASRHVDDARALGLESGGHRDPIEPGFLEHPPHDVVRRRLLEARVRFLGGLRGRQLLHASYASWPRPNRKADDACSISTRSRRTAASPSI